MKLFRLFNVVILCMTLIVASCSDGEDGIDGVDGIDGINGTNGINGEDGADGLACWDLDGNGQGTDGKNNTTDEDINDDGFVDVLDCQGQDGQDGVDGQDGQDGVDGQDGQDGVDGQDGQDGVDGQDGQDGVDGQDGQDGADGNANVFHFDTLLTDFTGAFFQINISESVLPVTDYAYLAYLEIDQDVWYPVPGALTTFGAYSELLINPMTNQMVVSFYNTDDALRVMQAGDLEIFRYVAIKLNTGSKNQENVLSQLKAAGVDVNNYHEVANYFGIR